MVAVRFIECYSHVCFVPVCIVTTLLEPRRGESIRRPVGCCVLHNQTETIKSKSSDDQVGYGLMTVG